MVLIHGDTTTSTATVLEAFYLQIPVGHVESGLCTHNIYSPWPEEMNNNLAAENNTALTEPFMTPDGVKVQVFGKMVERGDELRPEFRIAKVIGD